MKIAVTAATGQLGSAVVASLKRQPTVTPIAVARTPAKAKHLGVEVRAGDYDAPAQLEAAFRGVDAVLFVSGMAPPEPRVVQHKGLIDAAARSGVKHVVYTGIVIGPAGEAFAGVQRASVATEEYLQKSGMSWSVGRNSIYVEPDLEYVEAYARAGKIWNNGGDGRCAYTTRTELAEAYVRLLLDARHQGRTYNLGGEPITQAELAAAINAEMGTSLRYEFVPDEDFRRECVAALGEFVGAVIAGIYAGIRAGCFDVRSEFADIVGRPHQSPREMIRAFRASLPAPG